MVCPTTAAAPAVVISAPMSAPLRVIFMVRFLFWLVGSVDDHVGVIAALAQCGEPRSTACEVGDVVGVAVGHVVVLVGETQDRSPSPNRYAAATLWANGQLVGVPTTMPECESHVSHRKSSP